MSDNHSVDGGFPVESKSTESVVAETVVVVLLVALLGGVLLRTPRVSVSVVADAGVEGAAPSTTCAVCVVVLQDVSLEILTVRQYESKQFHTTRKSWLPWSNLGRLTRRTACPKESITQLRGG